MITIRLAIAQTVPMVVLLLGLSLTVVTDKYIGALHRRILLLMIFFTVTLMAQNILSRHLEGTPHLLARCLLSIYGYTVRPAIIVLFFCLTDAGRRMRWAWAIVGCNALLYCTALFSPLTFTFDSRTYIFVRGPMGFTAHVVSALLLIWLMAEVVHMYRSRPGELIFPTLTVFFITLSVAVDSLLPIDNVSSLSALTYALSIACVFVYIWFHTQLVKLYEEDLISQQRIKMMMSQIQPHFLYNTIATFRALCRKNPEQAAMVAEKFGQYLRHNLDTVESQNLIPIEKEMEHTKVYTDIECVRFVNIRIVYDVADANFSVPPLTVQPLVENAIRHGVRGREDGLVSVSTRALLDGHEILIRDNGVGMDVDALPDMDSGHIGIRNVRERIEKLCRGTVTIRSIPGQGTAVAIHIPNDEVTR